jgi:arabinose-5-phosphate isomerase
MLYVWSFELFFLRAVKNSILESKILVEIREKVKQTLRLEAEALLHVYDEISSGTLEAIQCLYACKGRVIVTGIGKSAIVAQKITATLNSTGTNAIFMHAADAIHGDLGMIASGDMVICISKSGETPEIRFLVPLIKGFGNILIAMVSREDSFLAKQADHCILLPMSSEADPNNLAPTTSTTLQMAMGDAIAIALQSLRGFSQEHFARFHPGGSLGKQLYLRVHELTANNEKPRVYLDDDIRKVILEISSKRLGATAVLDDNENLIGIITDGDLRRMLEAGGSLEHLKAADIMTANPKTIQQDELAVQALAVMRKYSITQLIVVEGMRYRGLVHLHDMIREGII